MPTLDSELVSVDSPDWRGLLARVPHQVYHLPEYVDIDAQRVQGRPAAFIHRDGPSAALLPLVLRPIPGSEWWDAASPYGYGGPISDRGADDSAFWSGFCEALATGLREQRILSCFVRFDPLTSTADSAFDKAGLVVNHGLTVAIDLTRSADSLWSDLRRDHRQQIARARRVGLEVVADDWSRFAEFCENYHETMSRVGADESYFFGLSYFRAIEADLAAHSHLISVVRSGELLAGLLLLECDGVAQYHLSGARTGALPLQPSKLALHEASLFAQSRGDRVLHLGGGVGGTDDQLFLFKKGFSKWHLPFKTWRLVTDPDVYGQIVESRAPHADPGDLGGYFPAYRQP